MKKEGIKVITVVVEFDRDKDLISAEAQKIANFYSNRGFTTIEAEKKGRLEVRKHSHSQSFTIQMFPETDPITDIINDIAQGIPYTYTINRLN